MYVCTRLAFKYIKVQFNLIEKCIAQIHFEDPATYIALSLGNLLIIK